MNNDTKQHVPYFVVVDLDRTLFRTDTFFTDGINALVKRKLVSHEKAAQYAQGIERLKGTDSDWCSLLAVYTGETLADIANIIAEEVANDYNVRRYFYDGALEFIQYLAAKKIPYVILTKGGRVTQQLKLDVTQRALGFPIYSYITDSSQKARWIDEHSTTTPQGIVPPEIFGHSMIVAQTIYVIDDKPEHLVSDNTRITGILIDNAEDVTDNTSIPIGRIMDVLDRE